MVNFCAVVTCSNRALSDVKKSFFRIPAVIKSFQVIHGINTWSEDKMVHNVRTTQYQSTPQCPQIQPVEVWCGSNEIVVRVDRFQLSAWPHPALYSLGSCQPTSVTSHFLFFHYPLTKCASASQVLASGQLVYSYALYYSPPLQGYIIRALPFTLPIHCYYKRFHYSYKVGYAPQVQHRTFKKSLGTKLSFSLNVCNAQWEPLPRGHSFVLGELINFVAQTGSVLPGEKLFVDSCYVTHTKDPNSTPKVDIITNYGCMTDSRREGSYSSFRSRSGNMLKFSINASLFKDVSQTLILTRVAGVMGPIPAVNGQEAKLPWQILGKKRHVHLKSANTSGNRTHPTSLGQNKTDIVKVTRLMLLTEIRDTGRHQDHRTAKEEEIDIVQIKYLADFIVLEQKKFQMLKVGWVTFKENIKRMLKRMCLEKLRGDPE
ncbi:zona pellucida glycoprotein 3d tandem duplicate 1 isoform X2 [Syngnathoides biaculeatus]|uniref:zona pellucida glycoprotein 3d tandem duplicate 1 isoform X2 n=2 Tax=Syngnathoides biaculeatus TaxID=300417 RepID=UPI002ADE4DF9|nr:zona pellucida glycoprotein 3d tandem duplicate 1 isoform X2 [Syngnathoides biaculeatus]